MPENRPYVTVDGSYDVTVDGSYGTVAIDEHTGDVIKYIPRDEDDAKYRGITSFNMYEFRSVYGDTLPASIDILDIGYWEGADYHPPSQNFRERRKKGKKVSLQVNQ